MSAHESEWTLRRLHAGELASPEATRASAHAASCDTCGAVLRGLESNQARFEAALPFERFEQEVQRALERRREALKPSPRRWVATTVALAASVLLVVLARPLLDPGRGQGWDRSKGSGAVAELRIGGGPGPQREVKPDSIEALEPGERVMLGYKAGTHRYVAAVSVDAIGEVTALHPESGASTPVEPGADLHWLEGSWEFTGSGAERVVLVLGDEPFTVESLVEATERSFAAANGEVEQMSPLDVKGAQTHWMLFKP